MLLFGAEPGLRCREQLVPVGAAGEQVAIPPHGARFDRFALGLRHRRQHPAERAEDAVADQSAPQRRQVERERQQDQARRQDEQRQRRQQVRAPGHTQRRRGRERPRPAGDIEVREDEESDDDHNEARSSISMNGSGWLCAASSPSSSSSPGSGALSPAMRNGARPAQQHLIVVRIARIERRNQSERIGARQRVRQRAHHEVQAPAQFLFRQMRQRTRECGLEPRDHLRVLLGQEAPDERRRIGVRAPEQPQEVLAAALRIAREPQRRE